MLIGDILKMDARLYPDKIGIVDDHGTRLTWKQLNDRVNSLSNALLALGLTRGDRVAIISESSLQFVEFLFAGAKAGLIGTAFNYRSTVKQLEYLIGDCEPKAIFVQNKFAPVVNSIRPEQKGVKYLIGIGEGHGCPYDYETLVARYPANEPEVELGEDDVWQIMYSSGTTGLPKGVVITHKSFAGTYIADLLVSRYIPDDVVLISAPLYTTAGKIRLFAIFFAGATAAIHVFSGKSFVEMVEREKVTMTHSMIPARYRIIRDYIDQGQQKYDLSSLRKLQIGPQAVTVEQLREMIEFFGVSYVTKMYASTEGGYVTVLLASDVAAGLSPKATEKERKRLESVGKPNLDLELRIVGENGQDVPPGQVGEILVRGPGVHIKEYWKQPELTQTALAGGWYHSSDLGMLDEDGYLYFVGRKDYMIRSGALFVAPPEVENVIRQHPAVNEVAVFGIPDEKWGEAVKAVISLRKRQSATEDEIRNYCRQFLADYQVPKSVDFMEELPRDPSTGRILVRELKRLYRQ